MSETAPRRPNEEQPGIEKQMPPPQWDGHSAHRSIDTAAEVTEVRPIEKELLLSSPIEKSAKRIICFLLIAMPLCFGAVHSIPYHSASLIIFILSAVVLVSNMSAAQAAFTPTTGKITLALLSLFALSAASEIVFRGSKQISHPVLGSVSALSNSHASLAALHGLALFFTSFVLFRVVAWSFSGRSLDNLSKICAAIAVFSTIFAFIGLMHWFSDNGKLFWRYAPDVANPLDRLRWPFVNPNHLACFLLPGLFVLAARLANSWHNLLSFFIEHLDSKASNIAHLLSSPRVHRRLGFLLLNFLAFIGVTVAIVGTLSRGGWLGMFIGALSFLVLQQYAGPKAPRYESKFDRLLGTSRPPDSGEPAASESYLQRAAARRHRARFRGHAAKTKDRRLATLNAFSRYVPRISSSFVLISAAAGVYFFLQGKGLDLFADRLDYGLSHSLDDIRWIMYHNTQQMIADNPWWGVGLGNWASSFWQYMNEAIAGINPVYLHSDPLQLLAEVGLLGMLPLLGLFVFSLGRSIAGIRRLTLAGHGNTAQLARLQIGLLAGILGMLTSSFVDFPLHIPAILVFFAGYFALLGVFTDRSSRLLPPQNGI